MDVGGTVTQIVAGEDHTCALLDTGSVRCWGLGTNGRLGYGNTNDIGDNETSASAGDVTVDGTVTQIDAGASVGPAASATATATPSATTRPPHRRGT